MKCLIIAAGQGSRLREIHSIKPLTPLLGVPLIERVIRTAMQGGVDEFYVVTGYNAQDVNLFLDWLGTRLNIKITTISNNEWQRGNGISVLKAKHELTEPFLLMMADHIFDPDAIAEIRKYTPHKNQVILAIDENIDNPLVDMDDVTKVFVDKGRVLNIGKNIEKFNGFDTGLFLCTDTIFGVLAELEKKESQVTLTAALRMMAGNGQVRCCGIKGTWIDVDDNVSYKKAEKMILALVHGKSGDGPVSKRLNRPLSIRLTRFLVKYQITPNQISVFSFFISLVAAVLLGAGGKRMLASGGIIAQAASVIDGCDGEVARLKYLSSEYGGWLDAVLDRYADAFLLFGLTLHGLSCYGMAVHMSQWVLFIGFMAIIGSFMLSYTADKYDMLMKKRIQERSIRIGRDIRVFIIFLGAIFNLPLGALIVTAVIMNVAVCHRILICRN